MTALEIACRRCAAQKGEGCYVSGTNIPLENALHAERILDAASLTANQNPVDKAQFNAAVEEKLF